MTDQWDHRSPGAGGWRASDADRERTAEALRRHHLDGRLDTEELQERLERCYAARTEAELHALLGDRPAERPAPRPAAAWRGRAAGLPPVAVVLLVALALAATVAAVGHGHPGPLPFLLVLLVWRLGRRPRGRRAYGGFRV
jgi:hypothetical protein